MNRSVVVLARWWEVLQEEQADAVDRIPARWTGAAIFLAGALALYAEMVIVRWHATCFHAFAIFKNVSLLSCFLGLGIGYGLAGRRRARTKCLLAAACPSGDLVRLAFDYQSRRAEHQSGRRANGDGHGRVSRGAGSTPCKATPSWRRSSLLNAVMFVPLGQLAGRLMARLPNGQSYALNLLGSLAGIGVFFLLSLACTLAAGLDGIGYPCSRSFPDRRPAADQHRRRQRGDRHDCPGPDGPALRAIVLFAVPGNHAASARSGRRSLDADYQGESFLLPGCLRPSCAGPCP